MLLDGVDAAVSATIKLWGIVVGSDLSQDFLDYTIQIHIPRSLASKSYT
jgi:hypothetical protein